MNEGLVDLALLRENIKKADYEGKSSFSFKIGSKIIKVYARKEDHGFFNPPDTSSIVDFSKYYADTIVFPEEYIYEITKELEQAIDTMKTKLIIEPGSASIGSAIELHTSVIDVKDTQHARIVTTDGSITDIPREEYLEAEERVIKELMGYKASCGLSQDGS